MDNDDEDADEDIVFRAKTVIRYNVYGKRATLRYLEYHLSNLYMMEFVCKGFSEN